MGSKRHERTATARRRAPSLEGLEARLVLSATGKAAAAQAASALVGAQTSLGNDGVDALATGDFNGDQLLDIAVAGRQSGHYVINIYDGAGKSDSESPTGALVNPLLVQTLVDPLGPGVGPLTIAAGDFTGLGLTELAVASATGQTSKVDIWAPQLADPSAPPTNAKVTLSKISSFVPKGLEQAQGLQLAAADLDGLGNDELVAGPAGAGSDSLDVLRYDAGTSTWALAKQFSLDKVGIAGGVSVAAGALDASGKPVIVLGSRTNGLVKVLNGSNGSVQRTLRPLGSDDVGVRVAVVTNEYADGALVVTPLVPTAGVPAASIVSATNWKPRDFTPAQSPGTGALVPFGGGWVYPRSSIKDASGSFPYSDGPATPTVFLASTEGTQLVVQGFRGDPNNLSPSTDSKDVFKEPVLSSATPDAAFTPLQEQGDMPGLSVRYKTPAAAFPQSIVYRSPYRINLNGLPSTIYKGLQSSAPFSSPKNDGWGPDRPTIAPPNVPAVYSPSQASFWLKGRLIAAYSQAVGVAYQHHYDPFWQPVQGTRWNAASIGFQSQGIDCTNFTAYAYNSALGIQMNSDTHKQASITSASSPYISIPQSMLPYVHVEVIKVDGTSLADYNHLVKDVLQPGDIMFIAPSKKTGSPMDPDKVTHAITWLGSFATDTNGVDKNLIIDSTGNAPVHVDSNNHLIKPGAEIRPFSYGTEDSKNAWYFNHIDHILRIIVTPKV